MAKSNKLSRNSDQATSGPITEPSFSFAPYLKYAPWLLVVLFLVFYFPLLFGGAYLWEDVIEQHYPNTVYTMSSLKSGELPHWTPYVFGGMPYLADMQTGIFYPPNWILFLLQTVMEPGGGAFIWFILLHILVFGLGIFFLARAFNFSVLIALYTAVALMFCGFISTHVIHIIFLYVIAWFPFAFLFLKKTFETQRLKFLALGSLFFGISILGGYAQYTLFLSCILLLYTASFALETWKTSRKNALLVLIFFGLFMILSAGLALIQLLPTAELSAESVRTKMNWEESSRGALAFSSLLTLLAPKFYGWVSGSGGSPFWGGEGAHLFWETACFIGILPLLIFLAGFPLLRKNRFFILFSILALLALLLMLGGNGPLYYLVFHYVPGFGNFRLPGRFAIVFAFSVIMATGFILERLITSPGLTEPEQKTFKRTLFFSAGAAALILLISLSTLSGLDEAKKTCAQQAAGFALCSLVIGSGLLLYLISAASKTFPLILIIGYVFIELFLFGHTFGAGTTTGKESFPPDPQIDAVRAEVAKNPFRLQGRIFEGEGKGIRLFGHLNLGSVYQIPIVEGYNQLHLGRLSRFLHEVEPKKEMDLFNVRFRARPDGRGFYALPDSAFCRRFSLRSAVQVVGDSSKAIRSINSPAFNPLLDAVVEEPLALSINNRLIPDSLGKIDILSYGAQRIVLAVNSSDNALLFASEVWYPAWHATVDGRETLIHKTNFLFRGIEIPAGKHEVIFEYRSAAFEKGKLISAVILLTILSLIVFGDKIPLLAGKKQS